jgi:hypothetical protein
MNLIDGADAARLALCGGFAAADRAGCRRPVGPRGRVRRPSRACRSRSERRTPVQPVAGRADRLAEREGDTVNLSLAAERVHFFDSKSGDRLVAGRNP